MPVAALMPAQLYRVCDCERFDFATTDDLPDLDLVPGQERALEALQFGAEVPHPDYHIFLLGSTGTGRHRSAHSIFGKQAKELPTPKDWVYVHNFAEANQPRAIALPPGRGAALQHAMEVMIEDLQQSVPAIFEHEDNQRRAQAIDQAIQKQQQQAFEELDQSAKQRGFSLVKTQQGSFGFAPYKDGQVDPEAYEKLSEEEKQRLQGVLRALQQELQELVQQFPKWERERRKQHHALQQELIVQALKEPIDEARSVVPDVPDALRFIDKVRKDIKANFQTIFFPQPDSGGSGGPPRPQSGPSLTRYQVNVLVRHHSEGGAPVVYEDNPTHPNLLGRMEYRPQFGTLLTDFTLIKAGALHRANGGFLILDAEKLLSQPFAWDALKRNLKAQHIAIETPAQQAGLVATVSPEPEPIPLRVRIGLVGSPRVYHLLQQLDPDFGSMFKVAADFADTMDRTLETDHAYACLIATMVRQAKLRPIDLKGVARLIEASSRRAQDSEKLALDLQDLYDLVREADFFASKAEAKTVTDDHVQAAITARIRRADRIREASHESITRDIMLIDTQGSEVGQVNGLSVLQLGRFAFGKPTRITCNVRPGGGRIVDIEREVKLGGPLHSKGVLILQGFIAGHFLLDEKLSLSASLVFEQSYGGVDGDSASSTELYALLSALSELPLNQSLAITGSVNQKGEVQAIGGVNEKIEGFFDICKARGLTGKQGVMIPASNVVHLMLRQEVVDAAHDGKFLIYPIATIQQGIELLTGVPAGSRDAQGHYPADTVFGKVEARLRDFAKVGRSEGEQEGKPGNGDDAAGSSGA